MRAKARTAARIATKQHGVVTRQQLLDAGVSSRQIEGMLKAGALLTVHRGVYRAGHRAPGMEASYMAAVLACGEGAVISGRPAGRLLSLLRGRVPPPAVTAPTERKVKGVRTTRAQLAEADRWEWRGIPVTSAARALVDMAADLEPAALARACHEAGVRYRTTPAQVEAALARKSNARGARALRRVMSGEQRVTLSAMERRFLDRLVEVGLPLPVTNRRAGAHYVDCRWPDHRLTVELDSYRFHNSRHSWEQDRRREREARRCGDKFRRYSYADVAEDPREMLAELRLLITAVDAAPPSATVG